MIAEAISVSEKQLALEVITRMPDGATYREMADELDLLEAIREGEADLDAGRTVTHEEALRRLAGRTTR